MTFRSSLPIALTTAILIGCAAPSAPLEDTDPAEDAETQTTSQALNDPAACPGTSWIGKLSEPGTCPSAGNWQGAPLFDGATGELAKYCLVQWNATTSPDLDALPGGTGWLDKDCQVVAPLTTATEQARAAVAPGMITTFLQAMEAPTAINYNHYGQPQHIYVSVVDSWPSPGAVGNSSHGFAMASIISTLACPPGSACLIHPTPALALNLTLNGVDNTNGGYFGTLSRIAQQIRESTRVWVNAGSPGHLLINLSIGWDSAYNTDEEGQTSQAVNAVRDALMDARCRGALVIAAAGNASGGESPAGGPMYPAAWEAYPVTCTTPGNPANGAPLVRAAGAVDATFATIPSQRPGARPRLVADGYLVPATGTLNGTPVTVSPMSGTSVSAAAITAAAAAVWSSRPGLTADGVAGHLYQTGAPIGGLADFCECSATVPCSCTAVKRVSMCDALGGAATNCRALPASNPVWSAAELLYVMTKNSAVHDGTDLTTILPSPQCEGTVYTAIPQTPPQSLPDPDEYCPFEHFPNETILPFSTSQPGVPICGACAVYVDAPWESSLEISINEKLQGPAYPSVITFLDFNGRPADRYDLASQTPGSGLAAGEVYRYKLPPVDGALYRGAVIEWMRVADTESMSDVVIIEGP